MRGGGGAYSSLGTGIQLRVSNTEPVKAKIYSKDPFLCRRTPYILRPCFLGQEMKVMKSLLLIKCERVHAKKRKKMTNQFIKRTLFYLIDQHLPE